jgi:hypothetical protein
MITEQGVRNLWEKGGVAARYNKLERARPYATTPDARRFVVWAWLSCERLAPDEPAKLFAWALEKFADEAGVNVLQPAVPNELKPPERWKDIWGNPLPNPFATGDLKGQTLVTQRDPMLAEWLKAFAENPYTAATSWADKQAAVLKQKAITYDADSHALNPYVNGADETEKAQFHKNAPPEVIERCTWEARPIEFPGAGKTFNLTAQSKISAIPRLSAIWDSMVEAERSYVAFEKATLRQQREQAELRLKALEAADAAPAPPRMASRAKVGIE